MKVEVQRFPASTPAEVTKSPTTSSMVARGMEAAGVAAYRRRRDELAALNDHQRSAASRAYQLRRAKQRQGASRSGGVPAREAAARARARAAVAKQDTQ